MLFASLLVWHKHISHSNLIHISSDVGVFSSGTTATVKVGDTFILTGGSASSNDLLSSFNYPHESLELLQEQLVQGNNIGQARFKALKSGELTITAFDKPNGCIECNDPILAIWHITILQQ